MVTGAPQARYVRRPRARRKRSPKIDPRRSPFTTIYYQHKIDELEKRNLALENDNRQLVDNQRHLEENVRRLQDTVVSQIDFFKAGMLSMLYPNAGVPLPLLRGVPTRGQH